MHGALSYEEMVRLHRANDLTPADKCAPCTPKCHVDGGENPLKGKTYEDVAAMPVPVNRVCPTAKLVVPATPTLVVKDVVKTITPKVKDGKYKVVDFNPCDSRTEVLDAIPEGAEVVHAKSTHAHGTTVVDTFWSEPAEVAKVTHDIEDLGEVKQPEAVNSKQAKAEETTDDGKEAKPKKAKKAVVAEPAHVGDNAQ